ncbi:MAG: zinc-ribbon domain-containing protein [Candidatus Sifarchaeia archaeon]
MRTCEKCGKANQPTRKFCIRCGASLIIKEEPKEKAPLPTATAPPVPEAPVAPPPETSPPAEDEKWVKPSQVATDRVRSAGGLTKPKSEFEKAKEAFAKAETVGIEEADGSGVIETRMLRASEVKELLEGPGMMVGGEDIPPPRMMDGSEPLPPEAEQFMPPAGPSSAQIEESILGSRSAYIEHPPEPEPEPEPELEPPMAPTASDLTITPDASAELSSSRYEMEDAVPVLEATTTEEVAEAELTYDEPESELIYDEPEAELTYDEPEVPTTKAPSTAAAKPSPAKAEAKAAPTSVDEDLDLVIACPDCGKVINVDMFEYPKEVYTKMGDARLKQARFFVVQGKPDMAMQAVRKARALYEKAEDKKGLKDVLKLVESLAQVG